MLRVLALAAVGCFVAVMQVALQFGVIFLAAYAALKAAAH